MCSEPLFRQARSLNEIGTPDDVSKKTMRQILRTGGPGAPRGSALRDRALIVVATLVWIPAVGAGVRALLNYSNTSGQLATPPLVWPHGTGVHRESERARLVVFAHPYCPCSRATIGELALIMARNQGKVDAYVFFYAPRTQDVDWAKTDLWQSAAAIPGVKAIEDDDGVATRRFGASTSGQTLLYDRSGRLLFNGGITASRGHSGDNDGRDSITALLEGGTAHRNTTPVFGCSLLGPE